MSLENLIYVMGLVLAVAGLGGLGWIFTGELRLRAARRSRLATAGADGGAPRAPTVEKRGSAIADQVMSTVRQLGQQSAVRDPAKLSLLRSRLMQAGFYNREAPVIFLGIK